MSYHSMTGLGAYRVMPTSRVRASYSGFGAVGGFDASTVYAQWAKWVPICAPLKGKATCEDADKVSSVKAVQAALVAAGYAVDPAESSIGRWYNSSRAAWAEFAASSGATPSGDSYESFTLSDFQKLASAAGGGASAGGGSSGGGTTKSGMGIVWVGVVALGIAGLAVFARRRKGRA